VKTPAQVLADGVGTAFPSAVGCGSARGFDVVSHAAGDAELHTVFDLASLTKPLCVGTLLMWAVSEGRISLDDDVFGRGTVAQLAGHTSGLPAHRHFYLKPDVPIRDQVMAEPLIAAPGAQAVYSDLGYMLLGWHLEAVYGRPLDELFERVKEAFYLRDVGFSPDSALLSRVAPTEDCAWRGKVLHGEVHDPNAHALGGVAGHAGLFGTAHEVHRWGLMVLDAWHGRPSPVDSDVLRRFLKPQPRTSWRLCFDSVSPGYSSAGSSFGPNAFGHLGFTGTSLWLEPDREWVAVLLSNRVHPLVIDKPPIKALRPRFHDAFAALARPVVDSPETV